MFGGWFGRTYRFISEIARRAATNCDLCGKRLESWPGDLGPIWCPRGCPREKSGIPDLSVPDAGPCAPGSIVKTDTSESSVKHLSVDL